MLVICKSEIRHVTVAKNIRKWLSVLMTGYPWLWFPFFLSFFLFDYGVRNPDHILYTTTYYGALYGVLFFIDIIRTVMGAPLEALICGPTWGTSVCTLHSPPLIQRSLKCMCQAVLKKKKRKKKSHMNTSFNSFSLAFSSFCPFEKKKKNMEWKKNLNWGDNSWGSTEARGERAGLPPKRCHVAKG